MITGMGVRERGGVWGVEVEGKSGEGGGVWGKEGVGSWVGVE